ncbi:thiol reductant ABC exporter subunit CydC [Schaalia hyovaginalis]|uniref:ATP-binding cassette subfamily C protein CydC n=1 Tax=Schaalia hyovaginalis TaxID=29316 RepID=A0A923IXU3_9ACTO|nr:thiol reductant ABC exporter subunit CydC [Schaalia hyovaginalis]MBB6334490.1 ATP-binding cassette subfamily C protein CydC [Schaalia hyovaginalis]MDY2668666.1 thiol reductant ABC exporter subunit CydC [Schaalia hyovaginalis]
MKILTDPERAALRRIIPLLEVDKKGFALSVLLGSGALGAAIALSATAAWLIARASEHPPVLFLTVAAVSVRLFGVSRAVLRYCQRLASHRVALEGMDSLRQNLYRILSMQRIDTLTSIKRGDLLARTGRDVDDVGDLVVKTFLPVIVAAVVALGTVIGIGLVSPASGLVLALSLLISGALAPLLSSRAARIAQIDTTEARTQLAAHTLALLEGASELQVAGRIDEVRSAIADSESRLVDASNRAARLAALAAGIDRAAMGVAVVAALLIGIPSTSGGLVAPVMLAVLVLTPLASFEGTAELAPAMVQLVRSANAAARIDELLAHDAPVGTHPVPASTAPTLSARGLAIGWPEGPVLAEGIDLDLEPGRSLALVGPSGIGKTTLAFTLAGLIPAKAGAVTIGGTDVWAAERTDLSRLLTVTAEDAHVFASTVLENLRVANGALSEDEAEALLRRAGLEQWIDALPAGVHTPIGSQGTTVSGGERRRLLIARALASPAPLLILDEAGEHLDASTADALIADVLSDAERGILLISHRLSALENADEIIVLGPGPDGPARILDRGAHAELAERSAPYRWALAQEDEQ